MHGTPLEVPVADPIVMTTAQEIVKNAYTEVGQPDLYDESKVAYLTYDQFAYKLLTAEGSNIDNPAASYFKILREPTEAMENTTHLFLAVRFSCNKCHDHPFERWTQDQYYQTAAYFARLELKTDPASAWVTRMIPVSNAC